jgi:chromosome segregation ATPase
MVKPGQYQEVDLDRTDQLPILEGVLIDSDVHDDAIRMDDTAPVPTVSLKSAADFIRSSPVDLPSLAESVRSVEMRIERQNAEYEALSRSFERAREAESAAVARATSLEKDLAESRSSLEAEQTRAREIEKSLGDRAASVDAAMVQVLHSLKERDAQLAAMQLDHAKLLPVLEAGAKTVAQLEVDLKSARAQATGVSAELAANQAMTAAVSAQFRRSEMEVNASRSELAAAQAQASSYLELLRTRDWRSGFHQNLFRELDTRADAADSGRDALRSERDQLQAQVINLDKKVAAQTGVIDELQRTAATHTAALDKQAKDLGLMERARAEWVSTLAAAESETAQLRRELSSSDHALAEARVAITGHVEQLAQLQSKHAAEIGKLNSDAENREEEMNVLMAHLQEARRPIQLIEADMQRLREELTAKTDAIKELTEEGEKLRAALERTRGALQEREFLIRRLERSESNNATALGRIQTSMERLGAAATTAPAAPAAVSPEWSAELIRIDGDSSVSHTLGRRTRIGRATGCELHIDSSSVSRHHALIIGGPREAIIEDLNSTNGVIVNGRKVTRQVLSDGDIVVIGETQFRYALKPPESAP